ncbi:MAG: tRNA (guanosine(37)-N1)-methyltransferase TrmD, partial [Candidatus Aenigmarchaeota archaeon]|nr:tRNA (guanosine(37)-N1)-methyltransferase TrmD [Candidatus Aenigmarchaeota archaeon]
MNFHILTLFPNIFKSVFSESIIKRAQGKDLVNIEIYNLRDWGLGKRKQVDDTPYGGGAGMVLRVDIIDRALLALKSEVRSPKSRVILLTPQGKLFNQKKAQTLNKYSDIILICGHYEGFDERIRSLVDEEISIGDYILTGGEIPAMVIVDVVTRLIPGV